MALQISSVEGIWLNWLLSSLDTFWGYWPKKRVFHTPTERWSCEKISEVLHCIITNHLVIRNPLTLIILKTNSIPFPSFLNDCMKKLGISIPIFEPISFSFLKEKVRLPIPLIFQILLQRIQLWGCVRIPDMLQLCLKGFNLKRNFPYLVMNIPKSFPIPFLESSSNSFQFFRENMTSFCFSYSSISMLYFLKKDSHWIDSLGSFFCQAFCIEFPLPHLSFQNSEGTWFSNSLWANLVNEGVSTRSVSHSKRSETRADRCW